MMPVDQNGLDFARPPGLDLFIGAGQNAAAPNFAPLPYLEHSRSPSEVEVNNNKIWLLVRKQIYVSTINKILLRNQDLKI